MFSLKKILFLIALIPLLLFAKSKVQNPIQLLSKDSLNNKLNGPARAKWINDNEFLLRLAPGILPESHLRFALTDGASSWTLLSQALNQDGQFQQDHLFVKLSLPQQTKLDIDSLIKRPLKIQTQDQRGYVLDETNIQLAAILDLKYFYSGNDLGVQFLTNQFHLKLWSPTAANVELYLYKNPLALTSNPDEILPMTYHNGIWQIKISPQYKYYYYLYRITNYFPQYNKVDTVFTTDPYSFALSVNSEKSQIIDINDESLMPTGWKTFQKNYNDKPTDFVIYETHIRDWTVGDATLSDTERGSYQAFQNTNSASYKYLRELAKSGVTHIHFLPFFDFATVSEDKTTWKWLDVPQGINPDSSEPQALLNKIKDEDSYNWGYDPVHYFTPEGSYAIQPMGAERIKEFRAFILSLKKLNLRIVQDVVFNHTYANGNAKFSVFDKVVPLYFYRLDEFGNTENSSCCSDTASENKMMEKLMSDALLFWARHYKIDAFRFDLMNLHTKQNMLNLQKNIQAEFPSIYFYGEAWSFGSLKKKSADAFEQNKIYGTGIGAFNDRLRDAIRGGTTNSDEKSDQGFLTGLYFDFNQEPANKNTPIDTNGQLERLRHYTDVIKIGLAGNLKDFSFTDHNGYRMTGGNYYFKNSPVAFSQSPQETINYVSAHDGYTLWDTIQAKAPFYTKSRQPSIASIEEKARMAQQALALVLLSQGVPFIEGGSELLRSKSGDQDSYNSGDWFNRIIFGHETHLQSSSSNNWGVGLPPSWKNLGDWSFWSPRLKESALALKQDNIDAVKKYFLALLKVRKTTPVLRLNSLQAISNQLQFLNSTRGETPGLIVMLIKDSSNRFNEKSVLVLFNANRSQQSFLHPVLKNNWQIHAELNEKVDPYLKDLFLDQNSSIISVPPRTTVVLVGS